ncbi:MAG: hypothetical protein HY299_15150 [Verrucomicrobia bacterium]|nr:hypothetical protein [Verrucomicrobiota bacterium]
MLIAGIGVNLAMAASIAPVINVLGCAAALAGVAFSRSGAPRQALLDSARALAVFATYRFALIAIPWFWLAMDRCGGALASAVAALGRTKLSVGATFGGMDFFVLVAALSTIHVLRCPAPRMREALKAGAIVATGQLVYLLAAALFPSWIHVVEKLKGAAAAPAGGHGATGFQEAVLWHLPALGILVHGFVAAFMIRRLRASAASRPDASADVSPRWQIALVVGLGLALPAVAVLNPTPLSLRGKKVVVHEKGFLNWLKPKHGDYGRLSVGMYGMLPRFFEDYGAQCLISKDLSDADLADAQLLMLIFPNKTWDPGQLERIWRFVRQGGSLLILGEHTVREKDGGSRFNEVLEPTAMRVAFDSATFAVGGWLESYEALAHPASMGFNDDRNQFGVVIGASLHVRWPARPVLIGRWGWNDPGDPTNDETKGGSMMGNQHYDAGEHVGDILLAAEQDFGRGRVMVFGDTSGFTNGILFGSHEYASALFAAMCDRVEFGTLRSVLTLLGLIVLAWALGKPMPSRELLLLLLSFGLSFAVCAAWSQKSAKLIPDGRVRTPNMLAYIDATHSSLVSGESWRVNGLGGLELTLMRNDYHVLSLSEFTAERLQGAGVLISAAPGHPFSAEDRRVLRQFIEGGGIFICTVGYPESAPSREVLADLGFYVGGIGAGTDYGTEPRPFGHFKAPYHNGGDYMAHVRFHAAWNVESSDPQAQPLAYGPRDPHGGPGQRDPSVVLMRRIGKGKAVVIADTQFATNQNLENEGGQPFEGMRENSDFWRWLLTLLNDQPLWVPPKPEAPPAAIPRIIGDDLLDKQ